ncbi:Rieske (2Fe-2S) protein [Spongiibacter taiwanensis]|uniref:Rieske (2Fe-2S) protein n=1 Tax=Spongiibacter taiwanensis TaxID=1748242 RepID=UPI002034E824|nr:Rieske (2Fe-2S) protein [Spongiibacter taiwanensis]USA43462.1 Rieske (2Fe-2S) protein [Spongiibacter taiwanensis]
MYYRSLDKLINLYDGYCKVFKVDSHDMMLLQLDGQRYLIESRCPHREHPLTRADVQDMTLICPLHGYRFDLASGALRYHSEEPCRGLKLYELVYRDNEVGVMLG